MSKTVSYTNVHLSYTADLAGLRQAKSDMAAMNRVINQTKSDTQKYEEHVQKLDRLLHNGKITQEQYNQAVAAAQQKFLGASRAAESYRDVLAQLGGPMSMANMGGIAAIGLAGAAGINEAKKSLQAYADLESTMTTLEVVYGDASKAAQDFAKFRAMAAVSPLETKDFTQSAQIMAQYGVETENITIHLSRLSEVAAGNSERMFSLALAFGQVKAAGRLTGQEVLQMVNAGFNPLAEISRTTGRSMQDLRKDMENGLVTFDMVANAFKTATEEGGRFNGMNEKLATTVNARFAQMRDEITKTREAFGQLVASALPLEGIISTLQATSFLAANMQHDAFNLNAAETALRVFNAKSLSDLSLEDIRTGLGIHKRSIEDRAAAQKAAKEMFGGMLASAISSLPSQIENAGKSYADALKVATDATQQHAKEISKSNIKMRSDAAEEVKKLQAKMKELTPKQGDIKTDLPAAVEYGTREAYRVIADAQKMADDAHLKKLEEQRLLQVKQNELLQQIRDKQAVMGIVK